jgi:hypothetical protein
MLPMGVPRLHTDHNEPRDHHAGELYRAGKMRPDVDRMDLRAGVLRQIWLMPLTQRMLVLAGLLLICLGYSLIQDSSVMPNSADVQAVSRHAIGGMALVILGGMVEMLLLFGRTRY